jgi:hypothetical protein
MAAPVSGKPAIVAPVAPLPMNEILGTRAAGALLLSTYCPDSRRPTYCQARVIETPIASASCATVIPGRRSIGPALRARVGQGWTRRGGPCASAWPGACHRVRNAEIPMPPSRGHRDCVGFSAPVAPAPGGPPTGRNPSPRQPGMRFPAHRCTASFVRSIGSDPHGCPPPVRRASDSTSVIPKSRPTYTVVRAGRGWPEARPADTQSRSDNDNVIDPDTPARGAGEGSPRDLRLTLITPTAEIFSSQEDPL